MKTISLKFSGMGGNFDEKNNMFIDILSKEFRIELRDDNPDFLIYSVNSKDYLKYTCPRIFFTAENVIPDFNICDYGIGFSYLSFGDRYIRFPLYLFDSFKAYESDNYAEDLELAMNKHINAREYFNKKSEFCSFVYSNAEAAPCRQIMFETLSKYKRVNSGGRYLNNIGGSIKDKREFQTKHKFVIAFENSATPGYSTEKIVHAFAAGAVPIYWGDIRINEVFNEKAFINCCNFGLTASSDETAMEEIINYIKEIDKNDDLYMKMLSEPAFLPHYSIQNERDAFKEYLIHIFKQEPYEAFRRNRGLWGKRYERKQRIGNSFYWLMRKGIPLRDILRGKNK